MKKVITFFAIVLVMVTTALEARTMKIINRNTSQRIYVNQIKNVGDENIFEKSNIEILKGGSRDWPIITNKTFTLRINYNPKPSFDLFVDKGDKDIVIEVSYNGARRIQ
jgi:hypothetical protein